MKMIPNSLCEPCTCTYFIYLAYIHTKRREQIETVIKLLFKKDRIL